jgi:glyoxylase-like metal-dependent hydrolase (beta-lactamase superfamily II)
MEHTICPGIRFEPTPGHSPGHVSLRIESEGEKVIVTGDMTHSPVQMADPSLSSNFDWKPDLSHKTRMEFFKKWAKEGCMIIGTHYGA